jgi:type II secretory pathway component PulF
MPVYHYTAVDVSGQTRRGELEASNESALDALLRKQGQWLAEAVERRQVVRSVGRARGNRTISRRHLIEFFLQINIQLRSGVALVEAITFGLDDVTHPGFHEVQTCIVERVRAGASFSEALADHPRTFAPLVVSLIRAGETSGKLAETCGNIRRYYEWVDRLMGDIRQALIYPAIVLVVTVIFFFLVFTFLIPRFAGVLTEIKVPLPWITRLFMDISAFMTSHGVWVGIGLVGAVIGVAVAPKLSPAVARAVDWVKLSLPIFGPIHHLICLSRLAQNLATLYQSGIPLLKALELCRSLVGNRLLEDAIENVESAVNAGRPINEAMKANPLFSRLMAKMVSVGEKTGSLGDSLQHVADYYDEMVPRQVKKLMSVLEPLIIVGLIVMVGTVALAVFLPIANMLEAR